MSAEENMIYDTVINSQKGVVQPQLITPAQILEQVKHSQADMPSDISLPIPTSATPTFSIKNCYF
jgi:hypothetical protein